MARSASFTAAALAGGLCLTASACSDTSPSDKGDRARDVKVALAYDTKGRGDQSFNDAAARGLDRSQKKWGFQSKEFEPRPGAGGRAERLRGIVKAGYDPVIMVGYGYAKPLRKVAKQYPKTHFAIIDDASVREDNVANLVFKEEQGSYVVGVAAGLKTKTREVGFIGGVHTPLVEKFQAGFEQGVKKAQPLAKMHTKYLSQGPNEAGFSEPEKARKAARKMVHDKVDVIFAAAGGSGRGVIKEAYKKDIWAIGVDSDQYRQKSLRKYRSAILTSMVKKVDVAVQRYLQDFVDHQPESGVVRRGMDDHGVGYSTSGGFVDDIKRQLDQAQRNIREGRIKVSSRP